MVDVFGFIGVQYLVIDVGWYMLEEFGVYWVIMMGDWKVNLECFLNGFKGVVDVIWV